jgi:hypothetical protein
MPKNRCEITSSFSVWMSSFIRCPRKVAAKLAVAVTNTTKFFNR